jgi:hypothetical protein
MVLAIAEMQERSERRRMSDNSKTVANSAVERLVAEGLVLTEHAQRLREQLEKGELRTEDWKLELEQGVDRRERV